MMQLYFVYNFPKARFMYTWADLLTGFQDLWYKILVKRKCISQINIIWTTLVRAVW